MHTVLVDHEIGETLLQAVDVDQGDDVGGVRAVGVLGEA